MFRILLILLLASSFQKVNSQITMTNLKKLATLQINNVDEYALKLNFELVSTLDENEVYTELNFEEKKSGKTLKVIRYPGFESKEATLITSNKDEYLKAIEYCSINKFTLSNTRIFDGGHITKSYKKGNVFISLSSWQNGVSGVNYYELHIDVKDWKD